MSREQVHKLNYVTRDPAGPPKPPPLLIGMASSPHTSVPKAVQFGATQNDEVRRPDLTTVAIQPTLLAIRQTIQVVLFLISGAITLTLMRLLATKSLYFFPRQ